MKLTTVLLIGFVSPTWGCHPKALNYLVSTVEHYAWHHTGVFTCVFYDMSSRRPFDNILGEVLRSPRLDHVVKLTFNGTQMSRDTLDEIPDSPSMVLIYPGTNAKVVERSVNFTGGSALSGLFNPATKVLVLSTNKHMMSLFIRKVGVNWRYNKMAYFGCERLALFLCNTVKCAELSPGMHPGYLFSNFHRRLTGRLLTYYTVRPFVSMTDPVLRWVKEMGTYFNTEVMRVDHGCILGQSFNECMDKFRHEIEGVDIKLENDVWQDGFRTVFTTIPMITRILVPRDRPLNAAELLLLPFSREVWILLLVILVMAEVMKQIFPDHFKNDPILLVVCGFERHDLHQAGRWEKIVLHSLIILMFFASNAFETRIISLMISKPSIQRIKTLEDAARAGVRFFADLDRFPWFANHSQIGKLFVNGIQEFYETTPGMGVFVDDDTAKIAPITSFDYERKQPFYEALDFRSLDAFNAYLMSFRNPFLVEFEHIHLKLVEAGIYEWWNQHNIRLIINAVVGRRERDDVDSKIYLDMDDILPAWMILGVGCGIAMVVFIWELFKKVFQMKGLDQDMIAKFYKAKSSFSQIRKMSK